MKDELLFRRFSSYSSLGRCDDVFDVFNVLDGGSERGKDQTELQTARWQSLRAYANVGLSANHYSVKTNCEVSPRCNVNKKPHGRVIFI